MVMVTELVDGVASFGGVEVFLSGVASSAFIVSPLVVFSCYSLLFDPPSFPLTSLIVLTLSFLRVG